MESDSDSDWSDSDAENIDEETLQKKKTVKKPMKNPFFKSSKDKQESSDDESDDLSEEDSEDSSSLSDADDGEDDTKKSDKQEDDEDDLIRALKAAKQPKDRTSPPDIRISKRDLTDISFHPDQNLIAAALIDGEIDIFEYSNQANLLRKKLKIHKRNVRSIEFSKDGRTLLSSCTNSSLKMTDVETSKVVFKALKSHPSPLYKVKPMTEHLMATGDEDGTVKMWDNRKNPDGKFAAVMESRQFDEHVNDIFFDAATDDKIMVASSGEGTIQSFNIRGKRPDTQSEVYEGEMSGMGVVLRNSKLVTGCGDGRLYMFNWGQFGYHSADFPGHPEGINSLVAVTDNVIVTGCEDGVIRAVHLFPHRFIGTIGHHEDQFPVEKIDVSAEGDLVATISHDQKVKFWNIKYLEDMDYKKTRKPFLQPKGNIKIKRKNFKQKMAVEAEHQLPSSKRGNTKDFFKEL